MTIPTYSFSNDLILPRLIESFNQLPDEQRTFTGSDMPVFKIKVGRSGEGESLVVFLPDESETIPEELYVGEATFLWVGERDVPAIADSSSFLEISKFIKPETSTETPSGGIQVVEVAPIQSMEADAVELIWADIKSQPNVDTSIPTIIASPSSGPDDDNIWMLNPVQDPSYGGNSSSDILMRIRPRFYMVERQVELILDGSKQEENQLFGRFDSALGILFDAETQVLVRVEEETLTPATGGWFTLVLDSEHPTQAARPMVQLYLDSPRDSYGTITSKTPGATLFGPSRGWFGFRAANLLPETFYAKVTLTLTYKQPFYGRDRIQALEPM